MHSSQSEQSKSNILSVVMSERGRCEASLKSSVSKRLSARPDIFLFLFFKKIIVLDYEALCYILQYSRTLILHLFFISQHIWSGLEASFVDC